METEKFKIQIDITGKTALAYNKEDTSVGQFPVTKELVFLMDGDSLRYFDCLPHISGTPIQIIKVSEKQKF